MQYLLIYTAYRASNFDFLQFLSSSISIVVQATGRPEETSKVDGWRGPVSRIIAAAKTAPNLGGIAGLT